MTSSNDAATIPTIAPADSPFEGTLKSTTKYKCLQNMKQKGIG